VVYIFSEWFCRTIKFSLLLLFVVDFVWHYNLVTINLEFRWSIGWLRLLLGRHWNRTFDRRFSLDTIVFCLRSHFITADGCTFFLTFLRCIEWLSHVHWKSTLYLWDMFFSRFLPNVFVIVFDQLYTLIDNHILLNFLDFLFIELHVFFQGLNCMIILSHSWFLVIVFLYRLKLR
jgi:hypothetical protein